MNISKVLFAATFIGWAFFSNAATTRSDASFKLSNVECTQVSDDMLHITCKLSNTTTGDQSELASSLINYDVKDADGNIITSGFGSTIKLDLAKMAPEAEYNITVFALVNGNVESQTITKTTPAKK